MLEDEFKAVLAPFTGKTAEELGMDDDLDSIGVDSIGVFEVVMQLEDAIGRGIDLSDQLRTVQDLYDCLPVVDARGA